MSYDGTLLFVSHNLDFARRLSNLVWDVHDGVVETYPGSLADYLEHLALVEREREGSLAVPAGTGSASGAQLVDGKATGKEAYNEKRARESDERKKRSDVKRRVGDAESKIGALEVEQAELEKVLADPATHQDPEQSKSLAQRYAEVKRLLDAEMARWEQLTLELEALGPDV